ncbi:hypothetical protein ACFQ07_13610, partial [Actinomadura adrarensis]
MSEDSGVRRALWRRISDLEEQLEQTRGELRKEQLGRMCAEDMLFQRHQAVVPTDPPPTELVHALRNCAEEAFQGVWLNVRRRRLHVLVDGAGYSPDPAGEAEVWSCLLAHADDEQELVFTR